MTDSETFDAAEKLASRLCDAIGAQTDMRVIGLALGAVVGSYAMAGGDKQFIEGIAAIAMGIEDGSLL